MLTPDALGLPPKFQTFRPVQVQALERLAASGQRWLVVQAPTGSGKTLIAAALARMLAVPALYVVRTKQLQDQLIADFSYAKVLKGRANYPTRLEPDRFPEVNASLCTRRDGDRHCRWCCKRDDWELREDACEGYSRCPYVIAKWECLKADLGVVNTALFLAEANYVGMLSVDPQQKSGDKVQARPLIVFDEADTLEDELMSFVQVDFTRTWMQRLGITPPRYKTKLDSWLEWAEGCLAVLRTRAAALEENWALFNLRESQDIDRAIRKVDFFLQDAKTSPWVYQEEDNGWSFKPVFMSRYAQDKVWRHGQRFLLMSATIVSVDQLCKNLAIPRQEVEFVDLPSVFPPARRPVYYMPSADMTHKQKARGWAEAVIGLDAILDKHPRHKTLVHTVSAGLAWHIAQTSRHQERMLVYGNGTTRERALESFKSSPEPKVLVAQSMDRGVDLPGDFTRIIVVTKIPFPNLGDKQIAARVYSDRKDGDTWYAVKTIATLVQMCGRAMRSPEDWSIIYIIDEQFSRLLERRQNLFPGWWRQALILPEPGEMLRRA